LSKNKANCNKNYNKIKFQVQILTENVNLRMQYINMEILVTEMVVSSEAKFVIPLKFLRKIKKNPSCELNPGTYGISHIVSETDGKSRKTLLTTHKK
jgi:hypothetical protein